MKKLEKRKKRDIINCKNYDDWQEKLEKHYEWDDWGLSVIEETLKLRFPPPNYFVLVEVTDDHDFRVRVWELKFKN